jgi:hypothetical protein
MDSKTIFYAFQSFDALYDIWHYTKNTVILPLLQKINFSEFEIILFFLIHRRE